MDRSGCWLYAACAALLACPGQRTDGQGRTPPAPSLPQRGPSERFGFATVLALLTIHAGMLAWAAAKHSPTVLEPGFLAAGLNHWQYGRFEIFRVNPPLVRMVAALPVLAVGCETDWSAYYEGPRARPEFALGADLLEANGERSTELFTIARWACIPFSLMGGLFCFCWARDLWKHSGAGLIALLLWCFEPNILGHGELITTDCAAASLGVGAGYLFWRWLKRPTWGRALAAGVLLGLAELAKMSWLVLFLLWPLLWLFCRWAGRSARPERAPRGKIQAAPRSCGTPGVRHPEVCGAAQLAQLACILGLGIYLLNLGYGFDGTFTRLKDFTFVSRLMSAEEPHAPGNRFDGTWLGELPMPVPRQYLIGFDIQRHDFEDPPGPSYLRGQWKEGGWWYYYLYGLGVKTPHGTQLLLALVAVFLTWSFLRGDAVHMAAGGLVCNLVILLAVVALAATRLGQRRDARRQMGEM